MGRFYFPAGYLGDGGTGAGAAALGVAGTLGMGWPPGFHCGFHVESASQRMGSIMEAMALVM